ncbi:MAG: hypothetical protein A2Y23_04855 [Clostridiales bacterium GWB2_37_7]|nr:MAG: hypothetical protein A2Y23_04855 [Clostridiales bacterium GWB2_37_7]
MDKNFTIKYLKIYKGGKNMTTTIKIKPIKATPAVEGKFAKDIIKEAFSKPSESAIKRNIAASALVRKLRG